MTSFRVTTRSVNPLGSLRSALVWLVSACVAGGFFFAEVDVDGWWPAGLLLPGTFIVCSVLGLLVADYYVEPDYLILGVLVAIGFNVMVAIHFPRWLWAYVPLALLAAYVLAGVGLVRALRVPPSSAEPPAGSGTVQSAPPTRTPARTAPAPRRTVRALRRLTSPDLRSLPRPRRPRSWLRAGAVAAAAMGGTLVLTLLGRRRSRRTRGPGSATRRAPRPTDLRERR